MKITKRDTIFLSSTLVLSAGILCFTPAPSLAANDTDEWAYTAQLSEDLGTQASDLPNIPLTEEEDPSLCPLTKITVNEFFWVGGIRLEPDGRNTQGHSLSCLQTHIETGIERCAGAMDPSLYWRDLDDCVILGYFMHIDQVVNLFGLSDVKLRPATIEGGLADSNWYFRKHSCDFSNSKGICRQGTLYFDKDCDTIANPTTELIKRSCDGGQFNWATPISLIWSSETDVDKEISFSQFPLDPGTTSRWYTWKGSEQTPLLVYDPEHSGNITSASQLFGNWTFGGKKSAALHSTDTAAPEPQAWRDGFEALSSLDQNRDGNISGEELAPLALWFDKDRDGVAKAGEVIALQSAGVVRLSTSIDKTDSITKTIFSTKGFDRQTTNGIITGALADWYGESAITKMELVNRQTLRQSLCDTNSATPPQGQATDETALSPNLQSATAEDEGTFRPESNISGMWRFRIVSDDAGALKNQFGVISFSNKGKDEVTGYTLVEAPVDALGGKFSRMVQIQALTGKRGFNVSRNLVSNFSIIGDDKSATDSKATLSRDGKKLEGESKTQIIREGKSTTFTYQWVAERIS